MNNWLWGSLGGNDTLVGGDGNDLLSIGEGNHQLFGDGGLDTVSFWGNLSFSTGAVCNLNIGTAQATGHGSMLLKSIERLSGSAYDDVFTGNKDNNDICGDIGATRSRAARVTTSWVATRQSTRSLARRSQRTAAIHPDPPRDRFLGSQPALQGHPGRRRWRRHPSGQAAFGDNLTGGKGADTFLFWSHRKSLAFDKDVITDLKDSEDIIDLATVDANADLDGDQDFVLVDAFTNTAGEIKLTWVRASGYTLLEMDVTGDGVADGVIQITGRHDGFENFVL